MNHDQALDLLAAIAGHRIEGGCQDCDAFTTIVIATEQVDIWHAEDCPYYNGVIA